MKRASLNRLRKLFTATIVATTISSLFIGNLTINASSSFTAPQAVNDHLMQDDWSNLKSILSEIYGSITTPLKIADVSKGNYTQGQLMGNGDIGAIAAGVSTTTQQFYFGKNDFWGTLHAQATSIKDNQGILSGGGLDIRPTTAAGSKASSVFNMKQDILNAQVITNIQLKNNEGYDTTIEMNSWTADTDNVFVTEVTNKGAGAVTLNTKQWVPAMAYASASATDLTDANKTYPYTGGIEGSSSNPILWTTRDTNAGDNGNTSNFRSRMATATTVVGTELTNTQEKIEANNYFDNNKGKYYDSLGESGDFTVEADSTVYLVTYFASSSGNYKNIKSVSDVQADSIKGISAYTSENSILQLKKDHQEWWKNYWLKSYSQFNDAELNKYYYGSLYILGSSNRPTSPNGKVNAQNLPGSMYGSWIPGDNMGWGGRYFLNYNQQAQYYASGTTNRMETAIPFNRVIAYDLPWQINNAANQGFDGAAHVRTLSPFHLMTGDQPTPSSKSSKKTYAFNAGSTDQKSNGMFAAVPMIFYYEYTLDEDYLKTVLYPHLKELLTFYSSYVLKTDDGNGQYHYSIIGSSIHEGDAADINPDLDIGAIKFMAKFLMEQGSKINENKTTLDRWQDLFDHTYYPEAMLPKGTFNSANNSNFVPTIIATDYQSPNQAHVDMIEPGDQPVELEGVVFPFQNEQLLDGDKEILQKVLNTLEYMNSWSAVGFSGWSSQNNGFPKVFPIAARAGWPAADLIVKFKTALTAKVRNTNLTYLQSGGALETIGAMEGLNSMLIQSSTTPSMPSTLSVFPNWDMTKSVSFERLGAKGNVEVSSAYDAATKTIPYVDITSKRDGKIALVNPWSVGKPVIQVVNEDKSLGDSVNYTIKGGKIIFEAQKSFRYMVMNDHSDLTRHAADITLDKYSTTLIYNGANGADTGSVRAAIQGNPNDTVTWTSSDEKILTVTGNGNTATIKAVGTGTNKVANVTVTAKSTQDAGVTQTLKVKVADASTIPTSLKLNSPTTATIYGPASTSASTAKVTGTNRLQLTAAIKPNNAYDKSIMWTSSDQNIAMVDKNGLVIGRGRGTVTITGTSMANPSLPPVKTVVTVTTIGDDNSGDTTLASVLSAAKSISAYIGDRTSGGGFTQQSNSPNWEGMQEGFQKAYMNALGVKAKYSGYSTVNISKDTAYFAAIALNEGIRSIDPSKALIISNVDRAELKSAIDIAKQYTSVNFDTMDDWAKLQAALTVAEDVYNNAEATQEEVDNALEQLQSAMSKVSKMPVQTISLAHLGSGTSFYDKNNSGYIAYQLGAVGLDLNTDTKILPGPTNTTTLVANTYPELATEKTLEWTVKNLVGSDVVILGTPKTGEGAKLTMLTSTASAQGKAIQQFDSTVTVTANHEGVAIVTATNRASGVAANYIVTVSGNSIKYQEAEISKNPNSSYIGNGTGADKAVSGSSSSAGSLAGNLTNTKGLQIAKIDGGENGGNYNLVVYYATTTARNLTSGMRALAININGNSYKFITHGMSYNYDFPEVVPLMVTVPLNPGENTLQLFGDTSLSKNNNAPNLDKIGLSSVSDYTAIAANVSAASVSAASADTTTFTATVAASTTANLNKVRNHVTYQIFKNGQPIGEPFPVKETEIKPETGVSYQYDKDNENIIPAGTGLVLRNYEASINQKDYQKPGTYTVKFTASDGTNNFVSDEVNLFTNEGVDDVTPPVTVAAVSPIEPNGLNGWYTQPVKVTLTATDDLSGVAETKYSLDNGKSWETYSAPITLDKDAKYTISYQSIDKSGNIETVKHLDLNIDQRGPTITVESPIKTTYSDADEITPKISIVDEVSGVEKSKAVVTLDGKVIQNGQKIALYSLALGSHELKVVSSDYAGNKSIYSVTFQTTTNIESIKELIEQFYNQGLIDNQGIKNSLLTKLNHEGLKEFINHVNAQSGNHISIEAANYLLRDANYLLEQN
ncbi:OmpL47-type beta-barrel domain-containing protein [Neobacillus sp. NPDC058068]|uniref:OmpL47-type beta-barrel domain-containing protein n=1 Tax=Neobacillus sp. NPDC058068 TaxID=3346325 RepID=UPI0036DDEB3C